MDGAGQICASSTARITTALVSWNAFANAASGAKEFGRSEAGGPETLDISLNRKGGPPSKLNNLE